MQDRSIHITEPDMARLRALVSGARPGRAGRTAHDLDRPYLAVLAAELDRAVVVSPEEIPRDVVTMNSRVRLRDGRRSWIMTLVFPEQADPELDQISVLAPIGAAVLGARVGQRIDFRVPGGGARSCEVTGVLYQPETAGVPQR
jgi:regulator of nucleoside diphosphate kinase